MQNSKHEKKLPPEALVSVCPAGEVFNLPQENEYEKEFKRLEQIVKKQRSKGREIVVVMGVGFVGAVMAGVVADSVDAKRREIRSHRGGK